MSHPTRLAVWASGSGTNAEKLFERFPLNASSICTKLLICNRAAAAVCGRAKKHGIPTHIFSNTTLAHDPEKVLDVHKKYRIDWILLAGFVRQVHARLIQAYPRRILNIHPALLPAYGGRGMYGMRVHEAVLANNEKESGISIHYVSEAYDAGEVVFCKRLALANLRNRRAATLAKQIQALEHRHYPEVAQRLIEAHGTRDSRPSFGSKTRQTPEVRSAYG